jgi:competence protein ComFC
LRNAIHRLKYRRDIALGESLSHHLFTCLAKAEWKLDLVVPVPLGVARLAERGYNQASLLARPLAQRVGLYYRTDALRKMRDTPSQVGLTFDERQVNVAGSFEATPKYIVGKTVLVVDDVSTSGATLNACAEALLSSGAAAVYAITLARTVYHDS